jgi:arylsulfatase
MSRLGRPNVLLISLDCVRLDVAYSDKLPTLTKVRERGATFERVVSAAPLTPVSHASVLTGRFPPGHGIRHLFLEQLVDDVPTLAELLRARGYSTHAVVSSPGLHRWYGVARGFDSYDDQLPLGPDGRDALHTVDVQVRGRAAKRAVEVVDRSRALLDGMPDAPFFLFIHFFDAHWPYEPPAPFDRLPAANPYEGEVAYVDWMLGDFLDDLERRGLMDDLLLVVMADHGEDLGGWYPNDHGGERLGHPEEDGHGCLLYDVTQLVPLIFVMPSLAARRIGQQVRLVDIMPTILDVLGIEGPPILDGVSLVPHLRGEGRDLVGYCETHYPRESPQLLAKHPHLQNLKAVRIRRDDAEFKVIWQIGGDPVAVYDLRADPHERSNLLGSEADATTTFGRLWATSNRK